MPLNLFKKWPQTYGFDIYGKGPSYVVSVERGSLAYKSGLMPGDQILEVGGQDVTQMSADEIKLLSKSISGQPPELEVVSCLQTTIVSPDHNKGYGFTVGRDRPVVVQSVEFGSPAFLAGLRTGDIILEVNSRSPVSMETIQTFLALRPEKLTLLVIPVSQMSNLVHVDKNISHLNEPDIRLYQAKDLHNKMEHLLGDDYESKMSIVAALKHYAEDRDLSTLCQLLNHVLRSSEERNILKQIRHLIPPNQRPEFDALMYPANDITTTFDSHFSIEAIPSIDTQLLGQKKTIQIVREDESFGFVIKSSNPAYIESIDTGGAAEQAGLKNGDILLKLNNIDIRKFDHDKIVQLLRDSGSAPTLEILRCSKYGSMRSLSSSSSSSSHDSLDSVLFNPLVTDDEGQSFSQQIYFLLTTKERKVLIRALKNYNINREVVELHETLSNLLDTPSKKILWHFLFLQLPPSHRDYVSHRVSLQPFRMGEVAQQLEEKIPDFPSSFQQQVDFLLTSAERDLFRKCLKEYFQNHDVQYLIRTMNSFMDTPSKRILWKAVLSAVSQNDKTAIIEQINIPGSKQDIDFTEEISDEIKTSGKFYISSSDESKDGDSIQVDTATNTEEDILYGHGKIYNTKNYHGFSHDEQARSSKSSESWDNGESSGESKSYEDHLMKELGETKKAVQEIRDALMVKKKRESVDQAGYVRLTESNDVKSYVTIIPVGQDEDTSEKKHLKFFPKDPVEQAPNYVKDVVLQDSRINNSYDESSEEEDVESTISQSSQVPPPQVSQSWNSWVPTSQTQKTFPIQTHQKLTPPPRTSDTTPPPRTSDTTPPPRTSDTTPPLGSQTAPTQMPAGLTTTNTSPSAGPDTPPSQSSPNRVTFGLKTVRIGNQSWKNTEKNQNDQKLKREGANQATEPLVEKLPPPPPPPPLKPNFFEENTNRMSVKRINWEKLDNKSVHNTIWEKLNENDLSEVIRYLELETQFSIKPSQQRDIEKRKEILIMDQKKAYNISILLGHLKMSVADIKKALYRIDENVLTPELLRQLLAFAPNEYEIGQYKQFSGDLSRLTKPDQFAYQMSLVGNYEERLKSLLFKANFKEKCQELQEHLQDILKASSELKNSKKLARLLEIILAMGNYMNKGNNRIGQAAGFRITFLKQLDTTKTSNKSSSFLHVLADAAFNKFPEVLSLSDELKTVEKASKVSIDELGQDIFELENALQNTSIFLDTICNQNVASEPGDCFQTIMSDFLKDAKNEIEGLKKLYSKCTGEVSNTVAFFGEDPNTVKTSEVFGIFSQFIHSFERAHSHNLIFKRR
ncbi:delphilin-like [Physella acuta]|uniref:delphilin-like n=1 Tax=Physella acuta TaxID=109671 RepID=UPI0027DD4418|nr:delphilin-like [Physella acuta]